MTERSFADAFARLPAHLPPGRLVSAAEHCSGSECSHLPVLWCSDEPLKDAADWWRRLDAQRAATGLLPVLLLYCDYVSHSGGPWDDAAFDVTDYFRGEWQRYLRQKAEWDAAPPVEVPEGVVPWPDDPGPPFDTWPGLAAGSMPSRDVAEHAAAMAAELAQDGEPLHLALVPVERSADVLLTLDFYKCCNHVDPGELWAVIRSWEDRFGARLIGVVGGTVHVSVAAPPRPEEANRLALEHYLLCPDNIEQDYIVFATYAERLVGAPRWSFWWD
ncbi:DUF4253 domain-containing protein [Actinoallomurus sp. NPDC052274]|uniref:DUF4253 domain-containing protein n=1 Tax=Actinoallomurus sp. NPDC052274 TaxID=3155420 RepID=UPI00342C7EB2